MKICWDNLEGLRFVAKSGHFYLGKRLLHLDLWEERICNEAK